MPLLNRPGFFERSIYVNPEDGQNLNRAFPGRADGTWSERFAHHLLNDVVVHCDYAMDLHAGDMIEDLEPFVAFAETGNAGRRRPNAAHDQQLRRALGDQSRAQWRAAGHAIRRRRRARRSRPSSPSQAAAAWSKPSRPTPRRRRAQRLAHAWACSPTSRPHSQPPHVLDRFEWLRSDHEGIFDCRVRVSD